MDNGYVVDIQEKTDGLIEKVSCDTERDLSNLILNIDKKKYRILVINLKDIVRDYKDYCKKDKNLEIGNQ